MLNRIILLFSISFLYLNAFSINSVTDEFYASGYRINIDAIIDEKTQIVEARVYFKDKRNRKYQAFSKMICKKKICRGVLPTPNEDTKEIFYTILYKSVSNKVYISKEYRLLKREMLMLGKNQIKDNNSFILGTDLKITPRYVYGFKDNYSIIKVPSKEKFAITAGLISTKDGGKSKVTAKYGGSSAKEVSPTLLGGIVALLLAL